MAYIIQRKEFYSRDFIVTPATLIPRPETELMVDLALSLCPDSRTVFADLGTGCGCIGLTLLAERPQWEGFLLDNSMPALGIAALNAQKWQLYPHFVAGDMFMCPFAECSLDLVAANPPYVASTDWVMPEVLAYEPHSALFSAQEGLAHLEAVAMAAKSALRGHGVLLMEHGDRHEDEVIKILRKLGYREIVDHHDFAGLPRCVMARA